MYVGYVLVPVAWLWIVRTRPGLHLRAVGEAPAAADAQGIGVYRTRYAYVFIGGLLAGLAGAAITLAIYARLVRRPDRQRSRLDRGRARHLRPVEPAARRLRGGPVRGDLPVHHRHPGRATTILGVREPVPGRPIGDLLPRDAAVPDGHPRRGHRLARGGPQARRRAGRARSPVRPRRAGRLVLVGPDVEAEQLHLDELAGVERELARRERRVVGDARGRSARTRRRPARRPGRACTRAAGRAGSRTRGARTNRC